MVMALPVPAAALNTCHSSSPSFYFFPWLLEHGTHLVLLPPHWALSFWLLNWLLLFSSPSSWGALELDICLLSICTCFLGISLHALSTTNFKYHLYPRCYLQICLQPRPLSELQIPISYPHVCQPLYLYPVVISHPAWLRLTSDLALLPPLQTTGILAFSLCPQPTCEQFLWALSSKFSSLSASQCLYWGVLSLVGMSIHVQSFLTAEPTALDPFPQWSEENPGGRSPKCCAISAARAWFWATTSPHGSPCE